MLRIEAPPPDEKGRGAINTPARIEKENNCTANTRTSPGRKQIPAGVIDGVRLVRFARNALQAAVIRFDDDG